MVFNKPRQRIGSAGRIGAIAAVLALGVSSGLLAHDFWIVPMQFESSPGSMLEVRGQTGVRFPTSQSAVPIERVAEARLIGASDDERVTDMSISGQSLLLKHAPRTAGQRVVGVVLQPTSRRVAAAGLKRYIGLEGAPELAESLNRQGAFAGFDSATMKAQKFAKAIVEVGQGGPRAFSRTAGHGLEIVPLSDPGAVHPGGQLSFRLLFRGAPVAGAYLRAGTAPDSARTGSAAAKPDTILVTNGDGVATLSLTEGLWNVRSLHASSSPSSRTEWDVFFGTLVFRVAGHR
jgi:uncharacterized GH25 family protein